MSRYAALLATSGIVTACAGPVGLPLNRPLPAAVEPRAHTTVLEQIERVEIFPPSGRFATIHHHYKAFRIHTPEGLDAADLQVFTGEDERLIHFEGLVITPEGHRWPVRRDALKRVEMMRVGGPGGYGHYAHVVALPRATVGSTIELSVSVGSESLMVNRDALVITPVPVRRREIVLDVPTWLALEVQAQGFEEAPAASPSPERHVVRYLARDVAPNAGPEPLRPPPWRTAPYVRWRARGVGYGVRRINSTWSDALEALRAQLTEDQRQAHLLPPVTLPERPREAARAAWRWVRAHVVPRAPTWAPDPRDPMTLADVVDRGVADHRQMARLVTALLVRAGKDPVPVLVPGDAELDVRDDFATPTAAYLDLVVLADEGKQAYIDPLCDGCEVGELAAQHQGRRGLALRRDSRGYAAPEPYQTPSFTFRTGSVATNMQLELRGSSLELQEMAYELRGPSAAGLRLVLEEHPDSEQWRTQHIGRAVFSRVVGGRVDARCDPERCQLRSEGGTLLRVGALRAGPRTYLSMADAFPEPGLDDPDEPDLPLYFGPDRGFDNQVVLTHDSSWTSRGLEDLLLDGVLGTYRRSTRIEAGAVRIRETLEVQALEIPSAQRGEWRDFVARVRAARRTPLVLERTPDLAPGPGGPRSAPGGPRSAP